MKRSHKKCFALLLYCLGDRKTATGIDRISISDWDHIIRLAVRYDVAPLLFHRLRKFGGTANVPEVIIQKLQGTYFYSAAKNMHLYNDFSEVCKALRSKGIEIVALKGAHLAETVYKDIALRQMGDIDILVKSEDLAKTQETLAEMGYGPAGRLKIEEQCSVSHHLIRFVREGRPPIEVHWTLIPPNSPFKLDMAGFWERAGRATIAEVPVLVLSPEDLLIHLCVHVSFNHGFADFAVKGLCDVAAAIQHYRHEIDWGELNAVATHCGIADYVYCTLSLTRALLGTDMPAEVQNLLTHNSADQQLSEALQDHVLFETFPRRFFDLCLSEPFAVKKIREAESLKDKISFVFRSLFPSVEHLAEKYSLSPDSRAVSIFYAAHVLEVLVRACILPALPWVKTERAGSSWQKKRNFVMEKWIGLVS